MATDSRRSIILTGFGSFGKHTINASWEAVKFLSSEYSRTGRLSDFNLIIEELPVDYHHVTSRIPELWKIYDPVFVIHVGVSSIAECITIESHAHGKGYIRKDIKDNSPDESNIEESNLILETGYDITKMCDYINNKGNTNIKASASSNADLNIYPTAQTACGLYNVIQYILESTNF